MCSEGGGGGGETVAEMEGSRARAEAARVAAARATVAMTAAVRVAAAAMLRSLREGAPPGRSPGTKRQAMDIKCCLYIVLWDGGETGGAVALSLAGQRWRPTQPRPLLPALPAFSPPAPSALDHGRIDLQICDTTRHSEVRRTGVGSAKAAGGAMHACAHGPARMGPRARRAESTCQAFCT